MARGSEGQGRQRRACVFAVSCDPAETRFPRHQRFDVEREPGAEGSHAPLKAPVVASVGRRWVRHGGGVVQGALDLLRQRRQDLLALGGVEGGNPRRFGDLCAGKGRAELLEQWRRLSGAGVRDGGEDAAGDGGASKALPEQAGARDGGHCCSGSDTMEVR